MEKQAKIYLAGHTGLIGKALLSELEKQGFSNLLTRSRKELDLTRQAEVERFFSQEKPDYVFLAAGRVGGISANTSYPAEFIYENLAIQTNVFHAAYNSGVKKLLFFGSACMYPKDCPQPMKEEHLLTGKPESTNEPYAIAKIAGIEMCQAYNQQYGTKFTSVIPANIYGPNDYFGLEDSHVVPALIDKFHKAKIANQPSAVVWGSGNCKREFIYVDDVASAAIFLMNLSEIHSYVNLGYGKDMTIKELVATVKEIVGYKGEIVFDKSKPDGILRKALDSSRILSFGWRPKTSLASGLDKTYKSFLKSFSQGCVLR